jgi:hypothetical protein
MPRRKLSDQTTTLKKMPIATITLVHAAGECPVDIADEKFLQVFITNVTKRDLRAFPWAFTDMHGNEFILRDFIFCKIVRH